MNRFLSIGAACWLLAALSTPCALAASDLTLTTDDLLGANWNMITSGTMANGTLFSDDTGMVSPPTYAGEFLTSSTYGATLPAGAVGLVGCGVGNFGSLEFVSLALSGANFSSSNAFTVVLSNDNDDPWQYRLFADNGAATVLGPWVPIGPDGGKESLSLDTSSLSGTGLIGFQIGSDLREDCFHTSVIPAGTTPQAVIPAPGALLLGGIGSLIVHRFQTRRRI
jgi:hypothetical protein